jgi:hypothetical protein
MTYGMTASVRSLAVSGSTLYVGGYYNTIGGASRANLAALNTTSAQANAWSPNPNSEVDAILVAPSGAVYVGGYFVSMDFAAQAGFGAFSP